MSRAWRPRLQNNNVPRDFHGALGALKTIMKERPETILVNEGANTLDFAEASSTSTSRANASTSAPGASWALAWALPLPLPLKTGKPVLAVEGDSAFGFSGMEIETICRYDLPVCVVVFNNNGIYRGTDTNDASDDVAPTVFVKDSRYDKMMEAFGGVGIYATSPDELSRAVNEALDSGKPTLINAVIDENAGTESGRIGNLNPQSVVGKK